jgi:hypothetical protein
MKNIPAGQILTVTPLVGAACTAYSFGPNDGLVALKEIPANAGETPGCTLTLPFEAQDGDVYAFADTDGSCSSTHVVTVLPSNDAHTVQGETGVAYILPFSEGSFRFVAAFDSWVVDGSNTAATLPTASTTVFNAGVVSLATNADTTILTNTFTPNFGAEDLLVQLTAQITGDGTGGTVRLGFSVGGGADLIQTQPITVAANATVSLSLAANLGSTPTAFLPTPGTPAAINARAQANAGGHLSFAIDNIQLTVTQVN